MTTTDVTTGGTVRPITRWGTPVMHARTRPVTEFDDELHSPGAGTCSPPWTAAEGVGLAATQVGVDLAVFVFDCPDDDHERHVGVICNPVVELPEGKDRKLDAADEGCLSLPGAYIELARPDHAVCRGQDVDGNPVEVIGTGLLARCLQHETDHLNGIVFGDRLVRPGPQEAVPAARGARRRYPADWPVLAAARADRGRGRRGRGARAASRERCRGPSA